MARGVIGKGTDAMKIRNRHLVRAAGWLAARFAAGIVRSARYDHRCDLVVNRLRSPDRYVFAIWHEYLVLPTVKFGGPDLAVLISAHADGQLLGGLIRMMRMDMVLGSTNRGGVEAVRQLVKPDTPWRNVAVTPDGPRGPRRVVQPGVVYVASRTGMKVVPIGVGYDRPWRAKSWDRFALPRPGSRVRAVTAEPIAVPPKLRADELEPYRLRVQAELDRLTAIAERWAETNRLELEGERATSPRHAA
jgi:lysophospholipid acyltransferase (LPLAT)-like uncharacterized protein